MFLAETAEDSGEALGSLVGWEEESEEEKLLRQAIKLSLEGTEENVDDDEEELLKQAIALSLADG